MGNKKVYRVPNARRNAMNARTTHNGTVGAQEEDSRQRSQRCPCGSGKAFGACCYRPYHTRYNLSRVIERLKDIKVRLMFMAYAEFMRCYHAGAEFQETADLLTARLKMSPISKVIENLETGDPGLPNDNDPNPSAYFAETLLVDTILSGQEISWFQNYFKTHLKKRTPLEEQCMASFAQSQYELFEVVAVRRPVEDENDGTDGSEIDPSWIKLRNLFTGELLELKDPRFASILRIWDILIGRMYTIDGFNLLSTAVTIITPKHRPVFSRMLLYFWWAWEQHVNNRDLKQLEKEYPTLCTDFQPYEMPLDLKVLCNSRLRAFLKADAPVLFELREYLDEFEELGKPIILAPDGHLAASCSAMGFLQQTSEQKVRDLLLKHQDCFGLESPSDGNLEEFEMVFFSHQIKPIPTNKEGPLFEDMMAEAPTQFIQTLLKVSRNIVVISSTRKHRSISGFMRDLSKQHGGKVSSICGSVKKEGLMLHLFAMSQESMDDLQSVLKQILGGILLRIENKETDTQQFDGSEQIYDEERSSTDIDMASNPREIPLRVLPDGMVRATAGEEGYEEDDFAKGFEKRFLRRQLMMWLDEPIPLLQGKTPRQAGGLSKLRPCLIELVKDCEHDMDEKGLYNPEKTLMRELNLGDL